MILRLIVLLFLSCAVAVAGQGMGPGPGISRVYGPSTYSDTFTGTNGTLLATHDSNWVQINSSYPIAQATIQSNMGSVANYQSSSGFYNASSSDISQLLFKGLPASTNIEKNICVRAGAAEFGYAVRISYAAGSKTYLTIYKHNSYFGDITLTGTLNTTLDHTMKLVASGTSTVTIALTIDGVYQGLVTDSSSPIVSGHPGWYVAGSHAATATFDDWQDY